MLRLTLEAWEDWCAGLRSEEILHRIRTYTQVPLPKELGDEGKKELLERLQKVALRRRRMLKRQQLKPADHTSDRLSGPHGFSFEDRRRTNVYSLFT